MTIVGGAGSGAALNRSIGFVATLAFQPDPADREVDSISEFGHQNM
jgi:hypothetical protein